MVPGIIVAWLTLPGVIVHELAHALFCQWFGVKIYKVKYFNFSTVNREPIGYVIHEGSESFRQMVLISIGPFFVNTILGAIIAAPSAIPVFQFKSENPLDLFQVWLGVSIAMHAFPSTGDASVIWRALHAPSTSRVAKIFGTPIIALIYLGSFGSVVWLDLVYAIAVAGLLPNVLVHLIA